MAEVKSYDVRFRHPCTAMLVGGSKSGKTTWILECLKNAKDMFTTVPSHVMFYYAAWQDLYDTMKSQNLVHEWLNECPQKDYIQEIGNRHKDKGGLLVVVDDMLTQMNKDMAELFQVVSHHSKTSVFFLSQSLFYDNKTYREMKGSVNYLVLFKNPGNVKQAETFFGQIASEHKKALLKVFRKVTEKPYTYLLFDFHQETPDEIRIRTHIFPKDSEKTIPGSVQVYIPPLG